MKRILNRLSLSIILLMFTVLTSSAVSSFSNERLSYRVEYKWGLVQKTAGYVNISLSGSGSRYNAMLTANTASWADHVYKVRDTLTCQIDRSKMQPLLYERRAHEDNYRAHDVVRFTHSGSTVTGKCSNKRWKKGVLSSSGDLTLTASGATFDMLSAFYYMRTIDYAKWKPGQTLSANIFSGKRKEMVTIKYIGIETVKYDKRSYNCYKVTFRFTSDGKKKSSEDISAWINTNGQNIPVKLEGSLPIGKIRCFYTGA